MFENIWSFLVKIPGQLAPFFNWLFEPLKYINIAPIAIFSIGGFAVILVFHLIHLVNVITG